MRTIITILILVSMTFAQNFDDYQSQLSDEDQKRAIHLEKNIMAYCCFGGPVYGHGRNQKTEEAKLIIRQMLLEDKSDDEILDHFRNMINPGTGEPYGNVILASPKASETVGKVSYWMVVVFSLLGLGILGLALKRLSSGSKTDAPKEDLSDEARQKIESELSELDQ